MADVGEALTGFDRYLSPWDRMRRSENVVDRRDERWPTTDVGGTQSELPQSLRPMERLERVLDANPEIPAVTRLSRDAGAGNVAPLSPQEVLKFILDVDALNPSPATTPPKGR